jgi:hypothetical protein
MTFLVFDTIVMIPDDGHSTPPAVYQAGGGKPLNLIFSYDVFMTYFLVFDTNVMIPDDLILDSLQNNYVSSCLFSLLPFLRVYFCSAIVFDDMVVILPPPQQSDGVTP